MSTYIVITVGAILGGGFGKLIYFPRPRRSASLVAATDNPTEREARQFFLSLA